MVTELSFNTTICRDYEILANKCMRAMVTWRSRREEMLLSGLTGKKAAEGLLRLQADYAKAYSRLEKHEAECELCRFVSKVGGRDYASISSAAPVRKQNFRAQSRN